jgi:two-component system, chemotaxis family, chemotaxis protein CheY
MGSFRALVVDDSPTMRQHLMLALGRIPGLTCLEASDGLEGIRRLSEQAVDLILTDLQMPNMSGFAFISYLRARQETEHVPIVVLSAHGSAEEQAQLEAQGVRSFLRKPIADHQIVACVREILPGLDS